MSTNTKKYEMDMCSGNLFLKIVKFCFPLMLMGILQLLYNAADLIVVSNFSDDPNALGAVGSTGSLINLTVNLFMGLSVGTNVLNNWKGSSYIYLNKFHYRFIFNGFWNNICERLTSYNE